MMQLMRTTIDMPDDLHTQTKALARDTGRSLSETVVDLLRRALGTVERPTARMGPGGLPRITVGRPVTAEDVRRLDDD